MDYFTHVIIRKSLFSSRFPTDSIFLPGNELRAITGTPAPDPAIWAFSDMNDCVFSSSKQEEKLDPVSPQEWLRRGLGSMQSALHM